MLTYKLLMLLTQHACHDCDLGCDFVLAYHSAVRWCYQKSLSHLYLARPLARCTLPQRTPQCYSVYQRHRLLAAADQQHNQHQRDFMLTPPSPGHQEVLADEAQAEPSAASKRTKKQRHRANKQQQDCQLSQQHQIPEHQPLPSSQLSVATACLLQGEKCQRVGESEYSQGLCEALQAAHKCKVRILAFGAITLP